MATSRTHPRQRQVRIHGNIINAVMATSPTRQWQRVNGNINGIINGNINGDINGNVNNVSTAANFFTLLVYCIWQYLRSIVHCYIIGCSVCGVVGIVVVVK
jgi:hypothetical protein